MNIWKNVIKERGCRPEDAENPKNNRWQGKKRKGMMGWARSGRGGEKTFERWKK